MTASSSEIEAVEVAGTSQKHTFEFHDLPLEQPIFFNVVAKTDRGLTLAYRGARTMLQFDRVKVAIKEPLFWEIFGYLVVLCITFVLATVTSEALLTVFVSRDVQKGILTALTKNQAVEKESSYVPENFSKTVEPFENVTNEINDNARSEQSLLDSLLMEAEEAFATPDGSPFKSDGEILDEAQSDASPSLRR